jgi:integrase
MLQSKPSISFFLDASRPNAQGKCLVKLNIYCKPNKKRYATQIHLTPEDWEKVNGPKLKNDQLKTVRLEMQTIEKKALEVAQSLNPFSFVAFEEQFFGKGRTDQKIKTNKLKDWFADYIQKLKENEQVSTAISYDTTIKSLNAYRKGLSIEDITPTFLQAYEYHMTSKGRSISTVGIYLRQLRSIINQAVEAGAIPQDKYPFKKYQIPAGRNVKKALKDEEIEFLFNYQTDDPMKRKAVDFWIFSYLCNGMNMADIIQLKQENVMGEFLFFIRAKTRRTKKKDLRPIKVALMDRALDIIETYRNTDPSNPYLFPILDAEVTPTDIRKRVQNFTKWVNKYMDAVRMELGIQQKVGTYAARHSYSTFLKRKGVPTEFIKEALGHSSVAVTESYLDSFTDDVKQEYANLLTQFNKKK